jgi:hypothetical protein
MIMEHLEETAGSLLAQLDQFHTDVRQIIGEDVPVGAKTEKLRQLREKVFGEIQGLVGDFDQVAQNKEKELMEQMARVRQLRDQVTVIRHGVLPMFAYQPPRD